MMYYTLFSSLKNCLEKWRETWSNQFRNMLICAASQLLQHADVGYNLPLGVWILHRSRRKVHQILLMPGRIENACDVYSIKKKKKREGCLEISDRFGLGTLTPLRSFLDPQCAKKKRKKKTNSNSMHFLQFLSQAKHTSSSRETSRVSCLC